MPCGASIHVTDARWRASLYRPENPSILPNTQEFMSRRFEGRSRAGRRIAKRICSTAFAKRMARDENWHRCVSRSPLSYLVIL